jgi:serine protease Do
MNTGRSVLTATLLAGAIIGIGITASLNRQNCSPADQETTATTAELMLPVATGGDGPLPLPDFTELIERLRPSIVNIATVSEAPEMPARQRGGRGEDPFDYFFRRPGPRRSLGSGFILDAAGFIITNHHVVEDATKIIVKLHDEEEYEAEIIGSDAKTDIAVIKIEGVEGLVPLPLGESRDLKVGAWVLAIGNPFGLDHTVTAGIVSAKGRRINRPDKSPYDDFIQTDAAINPGNSGGPLVNLAGQVVGINSAIFSRSGGNIGIGFAIPIDMARHIVPQLKESGFVTRGWLGVLIQPVDEDIASSLDLPGPSGALVAKVYPDSPAEDGGIEVGDVIVEFAGTPVPESDDLPTIVADTPVGKKVDVIVIRKGERQKIKIEVGKLQDGAADAKPVKAEEFGMSVQELTPDLASELGLDSSVSGVVVSSVKRNSPAEEAGLQPGDLIEMVGNAPVKTVADFRKQISGRGDGESVLVLVRRGDQTLFRVIKPAEE